MQRGEQQATIHFHIQWPYKLDWERFETKEDAVATASALVQNGETYRIESFDGLCPVCRELRRKDTDGR